MSIPVSEPRKESRSTSRFSGRRVHFIGIGGCGMSGLASMLLDAGAIVTGSEPKPNPQTFELTARGAQISRDQLGELLSAQTDLVVRTAAVPDGNLEYKAALKHGTPTIKYAELLGEVMAERFGIAVAGTHGKSTTTAMIAFALVDCGADPSFVVGGTVPQLGGAGSRSGKSDLFVAEACEFARSFHALRPKVALLTNIEEDHLDCYKDLDEIISSFNHFARLVPSTSGGPANGGPAGGSRIIANGRDANVARALQGVSTAIETVALDSADSDPDVTWRTVPGENVNGCPTGIVLRNGKPVAALALSVPGEHNLFNATMALAACFSCGIEPQRAADAIGRFTGVDRRMTVMGQYNGGTIVDDYGHHPTEIRATLAALRERYNPERLICIFQPHQHSRTRFLLEDFAASFAAADETIVPDIYFVRDSEADRQSVSSDDLVKRINHNGQLALHIAEFGGIVRHLRHSVRRGDLVVTMGAGNVWEIGRELVS